MCGVSLSHYVVGYRAPESGCVYALNVVSNGFANTAHHTAFSPDGFTAFRLKEDAVSIMENWLKRTYTEYGLQIPEDHPVRVFTLAETVEINEKM